MSITIFKQILLILGCLVFATESSLHGQEQVRKIQPKIMVIPFAKEGQSIRTVLESDDIQRVVATKVKEGFDTRGINTIDLRAKLKQLNNNRAVIEEEQQDIKTRLIELSGADIYVESEANVNKTRSGNNVTVVLTAYDAFTGQSFSNKVATSPTFRTENHDRLAEKAIQEIIDDFINTIQLKFDDIVENGRSLFFDITILESAGYDFDLVVTDDLYLSESIEEWMESNAYKNYYHVQGASAYKMIFDDVKTPLIDAKHNKPFRISRFANKFKRFLESHNLSVDRTVQGGNLIFILD